eukprot:1151913-Pelagomonas_calceolata.AAC.3
MSTHMQRVACTPALAHLLSLGPTTSAGWMWQACGMGSRQPLTATAAFDTWLCSSSSSSSGGGRKWHRTQVSHFHCSGVLVSNNRLLRHAPLWLAVRCECSNAPHIQVNRRPR